MKLNFKDKKYKEIAMQSKGYSEIKSNHKMSDAFMLLLKGVKQQDLSNLCLKMQNGFKEKGKNLSVDECYNLIQGDFENTSLKTEGEVRRYIQGSFGEYLLDFAYECITEVELDENGNLKQKHLGNNVISNGTINTSSWLTHSLYEAKAAQKLAEILVLDAEKAGILALLHDYGRKFTHDFSHVTRGFEALIDEGWVEEARATITHSFINAGRCTNCDPAEEGFYIDESGNPKWKEGTEKDDVTEVLEHLQYDDYDIILNIADLMATDRGITSPYDRVQDVATRKTPDVRNRGYFLSEFTNKLIYVINSIENYSKEDRVNPLMDPKELETKFKEVSQDFFEMFSKERTISIKDLVSYAIADVRLSEMGKKDSKTKITEENEIGEITDK